MDSHHKRKRQNYYSSDDEAFGDGNQTSRAMTSITHLLDGETYEVFLSFRGEETRKNFTDHLYQWLVNAGVWVFRDNEALRVGEQIGPQLDKAIRASKISIPIISLDYASSKWCLQELVRILECKKTVGQVVLPIFYQVDPSTIRHQTSTFETAFRMHEKKYGSNSKVVQDWRNALVEVTSLKGWESSKIANGHEGQLVDDVVTKVLNLLRKATLTVPDCLVGTEHHVEKILRMVERKGSNAVQVIVIHGMGGIGKTTLAKVIYNRLSTSFKHYSFLPNIREKITEQNYHPKDLQKQLISDILQRQWSDEIPHVDGGINIIKDRLKEKKVLILFDDVDNSDQLDSLAREPSWFKSGSILIITTRNKDVMKTWEERLTYELHGLDSSLSFQLFCRHAFRRNEQPPEEFHSITRSIISTTGGLPLAIEVIGTMLLEKPKDYWEGTFEKLKNILHKDVKKILKVSYDALEYTQQQIFLDIACLPIQQEIDFAFYMWDDCGFYPEVEIKELVSRSLIKMRGEYQLTIHDQLRDLGREIVREDGRNKPRNYSRLSITEEASEVLQRKQGTTSIEALSLDLNHEILGGHDFTSEHFKNLTNLRFLRLKGANLVGDFKDHLLNLRWLQWECSGSSVPLPRHFHPTNLVVLELTYSGITEQWRGWAQIELVKKLKALILNSCDNLESTPNFSAFKKLEILVLWDCRRLRRIHPSISNLNKTLRVLDIRDCLKIKQLPTKMGEMEELRQLLVDGTSVSTIPISEGYMTKLEYLSASGCKSLTHLPNSIGSLVNLVTLSVDYCHELKKLPESIGKLKSLRELNLSNSNIRELPDSIGDLDSLEVLDISLSNIKRLPVTMEKSRNLQVLDIYYCKLKSMPTLHCNLTFLDFSGESMDTLPNLAGLSSLRQLTYQDVFEKRTRVLDITGLNSLESLHIFGKGDRISSIEKMVLILELPSSLKKLSLYHCQTLQTLPSLSNCKMLSSLEIFDCSNLSRIGNFGDAVTSCELFQCDALESLPNLSNAKNLNLLCVEICKNLTEIHGLDAVECLEKLRISHCPSLKRLGDLSHLKMLKKLELSNCEELSDLDRIDSMSSLQILEIVRCNLEIRSLDLSRFKNLEFLKLEQCKILTEITMRQKLECLKGLEISSCNSLEKLPDISLFTILEEVYFFDCEKLTAISVLKEQKNLKKLQVLFCNSLENLKGIPLFTNLEEVHVSGCQKLTKIIGLKEQKNLKKLKVSYCDSWYELLDISLFTNLEDVHVLSCESLTKIKGLKEQKNLRSLTLSRCNSLKDLSDLSLFANLEKITVTKCEKIIVITGLPKYLRTLYIRKCKSLKYLPDFSGCPRFEKLSVDGCDKLREIRGLENLRNFRLLTVVGCRSLRKLPNLPEDRILDLYDRE